MNQPATTTEDWDIEIKPHLSFFDINYRELWHYRDLIMLFVRRDFVAQYKQTVLGPVWHIVQPALTTVTFLLIFHSIAGIDTDGVEPVLFYMSGITIWNYFSACFTATSNTFVGNAHIFGKVYFPRLVLPLSVVLSNIVKLGIQFGLLVLVILWFSLFRNVPLTLGWHNLLLPLIVLLMAGMGLGLGIIISSLTTKYRDFTVLVSFAVQLLMYATPVAYPLSFLTGTKYGWLIFWNPLSAVVEGFRFALFHTGSFEVLSLAYSAGFMVLVVLVGVFLFSKVERTFMDTV